MINTHGYLMVKGRHKGVLITRVPVSYLLWLSQQESHEEVEYAKAELERRGTVKPELDISGHALDRVSQHCLDIWERSRLGAGNNYEGIHAWLVRMCGEALKTDPDDKGRHHLNEMIFVFLKDGEWPVLKTVFREK